MYSNLLYLSIFKNDFVKKRHIKSEGKGKDMPDHPYKTYEKEWNGWLDFLGYVKTHWSIRKVKELLSDLTNSQIIPRWNEAVLYSFLLRRRLLNTQGRHGEIFRNLIEARHTRELENYANSDLEVPSDLSILKK